MSLFASTRSKEYCPQCQSPLQMKRSKQGLFLGCSAYPACDYLKPLQQSYAVLKTLDEHCPECHALLQLKQGHFGLFIGCSNYPECHFIVQENAPEGETFDCPECGLTLVPRTGRSGKTFYGCSDYPKCKFTLPTTPVKKRCPHCQCSLAILKKQRGKTVYLCANKSCQTLFNEDE